MAVLLDTHAVLWFLSDDDRLSKRARTVLEREEDLFFSPVSLWEIGIKLGLNRPGFQLSEGWWRDIPQELTAQNIGRLELRPEDFREVARLPLLHRDPFDRMLVVQAMNGEHAILSMDHQLARYGVKVIW
ncbi:MAG TPA: type II toxin-antitoxin system VapC family toxin [Kiritimatiellia bacterium]|nr:type II toxin-antitoxin system VapC family toxin [Kiritimatiellia bacterium]HMP33662.1 type II toxin-antitoxin system VapC family toxin [Kiritimatiellia bacterium]